MPKAEFHKGHEFAQVAETLGVPTDHIVGCVGNPSDLKAGVNEPMLVLYTPTLEGETWAVYRALLTRDADGIFVLMGEPEEVEGFHERLRSIMGEWLVPPAESGGGGE